MKKMGLSKDYKHLKYLLDKGMEVVVFVRLHPFRKHETLATSGTENGRKFYNLGYGIVYAASFFRQCVALELEYAEPENLEEECCGGCCWFGYEDTDGCGICPHQDKPIGGCMHCSDLCTTGEYVSEEEKRHHLAVLLQANRYRRDQHVPSIYRMPNPTELGKAIDFACDFIKIFSNL